MLPITSLYAALLALLFVVVSVRTISARKHARISLGSGDNKVLERRIRIHGNFAEYIPFALILLALSELAEVTPLILHSAGIALLLGRILHVYALDRETQKLSYRILGMQLTLTTLMVLAGVLLVVAGLPYLRSFL
jgi:uncharacterized membrane protein YecN with MAPEG domain